MAHRRTNGDFLEYCFGHCLENRNCRPINLYTKQKQLRFCSKFKDVQLPTELLRSVNTILTSLEKSPYQSYEYRWDNTGRGSTGTSADIVLHTNENAKVALSLKYNNGYLKHPRPVNFGCQANLEEADRSSYNEQYSRIVSEYYEQWKQYETYREVCEDERFELFGKINALVASTLRKRPLAAANFVRFLLGCSEDHHIIQYDPKQHVFKCTAVCENDLKMNSRLHVEVVQRNHVYIWLNSNI